MNEQILKKPSRSRVRFLKLLKRPVEHAHNIELDYLLGTYRDLFASLDPDDADDVMHRYLDLVAKKAIDPNPVFSEIGYLTHNPHVVTEVNDGAFYCGFHHWLELGDSEGRGGWNKQGVIAAGDGKPRGRDVHGAPFFLPLSTFGVVDPARLSTDDAVTLLKRSGVVDADRYAVLHPDVIDSGVDPMRHYVTLGCKERRSIHPFFDDRHYLAQVPEIQGAGYPPLLHYLFVGARAGRNPHPLIDTLAYAEKHGFDLVETNPLIHISMSVDQGQLVPTPHFDEAFYVEHHPECAEYPGGAFQHFLLYGVQAGYKPSPNFNTRYYYATHLGGDYTVNAYYHYLTQGEPAGFATEVPRGTSTLARDVRHFANPGPDFEELDFDLARGRARRGKLISFYLPQFHAFPENDEWWGKGFTEWRNLPRGIPRFAGHYQPRIPRDLSFYDLGDTKVIRRQVDMAKAMGIWGFAFYFYWFNRHRLMESPLDAFLADPSIEMPFMLIWANENWTRRWDGAESDVLIRQDHLEDDDAALVDCFQTYFADSRYIRLNGRPLMVIYRADVIPETAATIAKWKRLFKERHNEEPLVYMAQAFDAEDPAEFGFDGAIEFPPHKIGKTLDEVNRDLQFYDWDYEGSVRRYADAVAESLAEPAPAFPLIKTVFPSWDNNARRQTGGMVFHGASPKLFGEWLDGALDFAQENPVEGEQIVFINAWNEWCEGAYLEPDVHYGGAMLNRLATTVTATQRRGERKFKLLLIGHDAFMAGAQRNLLAMARTLQDRFGVEIHVLLLGDGELLPEYRNSVPTTLCAEDKLLEFLRTLWGRGYRNVILNTIASGLAAKPLKDLGFRVVQLVHELPQIIEEHGLHPHAEAVCRYADHIVFASDFVRFAFVGKAGPPANKTVIMPQGIYQRFDRDREAGRRIRRELGIPEESAVVLNVGFGDLRKGVDIFSQIAHLTYDRGIDMHFVWAGEIHASLRAWLVGDLARKGIANLHFIGERGDIADIMNASDVLFLTSREDPFPSVILEAMQVGLPVVAFENNGGFTDLISGDPRLGVLAPQADIGVIVTELLRLSKRETTDPSDIEHRIARARTEFDFGDYVFNLLQLFEPALKRVSVVVPNYNYAGYLSARLLTIFRQTYPIYEIIVLDDASTDGSVPELQRIAAKSGRIFEIVESETNGASPFRQWRKGAEHASGELIWIAEADDLSESGFIERLVEELSADEDVIMGFSDSRSIDRDGYRVYDSYIPYAESVAPGVLAEDRVFDARDFAKDALSTANLVLNVSSVLWRRAALIAAFEAGGDEALALRVAGDWHLYLAACGGEGRVAYVADALNVHRRHRNSVTGELSAEAHLKEIETVHATVVKLIGGDPATEDRQRKYRDHVKEWLRSAT